MRHSLRGLLQPAVAFRHAACCERGKLGFHRASSGFFRANAVGLAAGLHCPRRQQAARSPRRLRLRSVRQSCPPLSVTPSVTLIRIFLAGHADFDEFGVQMDCCPRNTRENLCPVANLSLPCRQISKESPNLFPLKT
jgi:hypothetical protein